MKIERPVSKQPIPPHAKCVFHGVIFDVYQWEQKMFDGTVQTFEKLKRADTVIIYPVLDDGRILLTEQEQPGKLSFLGAAGGRVDEGEDILEAAKRELLEETGYTAKEFTLWKAEQPTGKIEWVIYSFIAKGLTKAAEQTLDAGEKISLKPVTFDEFLALSQDDRFAEKDVVLELLRASLDEGYREELRKKFGA
ncbi:MAG: NUDIX hydrolase [Patescibacteria group bacterium]